jgi:hypothetical protein
LCLCGKNDFVFLTSRRHFSHRRHRWGARFAANIAAAEPTSIAAAKLTEPSAESAQGLPKMHRENEECEEFSDRTESSGQLCVSKIAIKHPVT